MKGAKGIELLFNKTKTKTLVLSEITLHAFILCIPSHSYFFLLARIQRPISLITPPLNHFLHYILQGYLQNFHLVTGQNSHTHQCPHADQDSPTPAQFKILEQKFDQLLALLEVVQQEVKLRGFSQ